MLRIWTTRTWNNKTHLPLWNVAEQRSGGAPGYVLTINIFTLTSTPALPVLYVDNLLLQRLNTAQILTKYGSTTKIIPTITSMYTFDIKQGNTNRAIPVNSGTIAICFFPYEKNPRPITPNTIPQISSDVPSILELPVFFSHRHITSNSLVFSYLPKDYSLSY